MKSTARFQRRRPSGSGTSISLFPFLAVLICTMGALVPLLLAISRTARQQAEAEALAKASEQAAQHATELQTQREDVRWRIEHLKRSRQQTEKQLVEARLELGHLEDHARRLREELERQKTALTEMEKAEQGTQQQRGQAEAELGRLREQLAAAQRQVEETRKAAASRNRTYAVVPYEGPNQTHRRPIYLECLDDAVVLQPEGIRLTASDFEGPLGPGNPLASALRAAREHLLAQREFDPKAGEPYPMLLVRPEGINAYYAARTAMKSWGADFGYELIGDDWKLAYQPPDAQLAAAMQQVVVSARREQTALMAAAPRHYGRRTLARSQASMSEDRAGGQGGSSELGDESTGGYASAVPGGAVGRNQGSGGERQDWSPARNPGSGNVGQSRGSESSRHDGAEYNPYLTAGTNGKAEGGESGAVSRGGRGGNASGVRISGEGYATTATEADHGPSLTAADAGGVGASQSAALAGGGHRGLGPAISGDNQNAAGTAAENPIRAHNGSVAGVPSRGAGANRSGASGAGGNPSGDSGPAERPEGYIVGQPPRERDAANSSLAAAGGAWRTMGPGEWQPTPDFAPKKKPDDEPPGRRPPRSLAEKRGEDWGLREAARNSVAVTRPIRIVCHADRMEVVFNRGPAGTRILAFGPRTESSIDPLIAAVWEQMESWGMAGQGMYWRPVLQVHVAPGAEQRFNDLVALLEGSGLVLQRK